MFNKKEHKLELIEEKNINKKTTIYDEKKIGDILGGFTGYLRHSKPAKVLNRSGMMANIFGENGDDSDVITALNLTKYQNIPVKVTIWSIKDKDGKLLKYKDNNEEKFPKICQFIGRIQRPSSSDLGLTAHLFGEMGGNADAVNELNKTEFFNSLVFCQIQLAEENMLLNEIDTLDPKEELFAEATRLTPKELKALEKEQQKFEDADNILVMQNFYANPKILDIVGTHEDFQKWIEQQPCIITEKTIDIKSFEIIKTPPIYNFVPLNKNVIEDVKVGNLNEVYKIVDVQSFLLQWNKRLIINYVRDKLKEKLGIPKQYYLDPNALYKWVIDNNVNKLIPIHYLSFIKK